MRNLQKLEHLIRSLRTMLLITLLTFRKIKHLMDVSLFREDVPGRIN